MSDEERRDSLADQAAAWIPPWERPTPPRPRPDPEPTPEAAPDLAAADGAAPDLAAADAAAPDPGADPAPAPAPKAAPDPATDAAPDPATDVNPPHAVGVEPESSGDLGKEWPLEGPESSKISADDEVPADFGAGVPLVRAGDTEVSGERSDTPGSGAADESARASSDARESSSEAEVVAGAAQPSSTGQSAGSGESSGAGQSAGSGEPSGAGQSAGSAEPSSAGQPAGSGELGGDGQLDQAAGRGDAAGVPDRRGRRRAAPAPEVAPELDDAELRGALEAILLVVDQPVSELTLAQVLEQSPERIGPMLDEIAAGYTAAGHGFELRRAAGGWRLYTRPEYAGYVERFVLDGQSVRLTQAALETLAVIAYKQPVTRSRISAIRGVNCDGVIRTLVSRGLVEECGTEADSGAFLYRTTTMFLEKLGLNSVDDLPPLAPFLPDDVEELADATR